MPAKSPLLPPDAAAELLRVGQRIRAQRKKHKVSATTLAEAAGMSRVTLHRIERGEASVTMGAYLSAIHAMGLQLSLLDPAPPRLEAVAPRSTPSTVPPHIRLSDYPQLQRLAWHLQASTELTPMEALSVYERHWRHLNPDQLPPHELALITALATKIGGGRLLV